MTFRLKAAGTAGRPQNPLRAAVFHALWAEPIETAVDGLPPFDKYAKTAVDGFPSPDKYAETTVDGLTLFDKYAETTVDGFPSLDKYPKTAVDSLSSLNKHPNTTADGCLSPDGGGTAAVSCGFGADYALGHTITSK